MQKKSGSEGQVSNRDIQELKSLLEVSRILNSHLRLDEAMESVLDQAIKVIEAEAGTLWLLDDDRKHLIPEVTRGPAAGTLKGLKLPRGQGIAGSVTETGEPLLVEDVKADPRWASKFDTVTGFITRSILCVPLAGRKRPLGCLQLLNKRDGRLFNERDLGIGTALAVHAAMAIENSQLFTNQEQLLKSIVTTLSSALDARDSYTRGHSTRVSQYSLLLAEAMGMDREARDELERAAMMHDIGKIGVRDSVLLEPGPLSGEQWEKMKSHAAIGAGIIDEMRPRSLTRLMWEGAIYHQEKYDGRGYPTCLQGEQIPLVARIIAIADAYDAMTTDRPYRKGLSREVALAEIERCAGTHFDPELAGLFVQAMNKAIK